MNKSKTVLYSIFIIVVVMGCKKKELFDLSGFQADHAIAIPLVNAEIDVEDLLESDTSDFVSSSSNGELILTYASDLISFNAADFLVLPDQSFSDNYLPASLLATGPFSASSSVSDSSTFMFLSSNSEELANIDLSDGDLNFSITNGLSHNLVIGLTIPGLLLSGVPYSNTINIAPNSSGSIHQDLSGYFIDLTQGSLGYNELKIELSVTINGTGANISPSDAFSISMDLTNLKYSAVHGDIKNQQINIPTDSIFLNVFQSTNNALVIALTNPTIKLIVDNSFGFSSELSFLQFFSADIFGGLISNVTYDLSGANLQAPPYSMPIINQPVIEGNTETTNIVMDASNSNISTLFNNTPKYLIFNSEVITNPGSTSNNNFVLNSSELNISTEVEIPLEGYAGGWNMSDTLPFDFEVDNLWSDGTQIDEAIIKFVTSNGWPLETSLSVHLLDSSFNNIYTLVDNEIVIESGVLDANGKVIESSTKYTEIPCNSACVDLLNSTKHVIISATAGTIDYTNQQTVKIYDDYKLGVSMALLISGRMF